MQSPKNAGRSILSIIELIDYKEVVLIISLKTNTKLNGRQIKLWAARMRSTIEMIKEAIHAKLTRGDLIQARHDEHSDPLQHVPINRSFCIHSIQAYLQTTSDDLRDKNSFSLFEIRHNENSDPCQHIPLNRSFLNSSLVTRYLRLQTGAILPICEAR